MDPWPGFVVATLERHGVATARCAARHGISRNRFVTRTAREGWARGARGVRLHPDSPASVQRQVLCVCLATRAPAGAAGETAAWLLGLRPRPPRRAEVLVSSSVQGPDVRGVDVRRVRWLGPDDITHRDGVPVLRPVAWLLADAATAAPERQRARIIDLLHRDELDVDGLISRFDAVGPVPGKPQVRRLVVESAASRQESIFQAVVAEDLARRGYGAEPSTRTIRTAGGPSLHVDVPLPWWQVAVETDGDAFHRTREQRRRDRRRIATYAATDWSYVPVDWRDWHHDPEQVLDAIDAAIARQRARGIGADRPPPPR